MTDTNITIITTDGLEIDVIYPDALGIEYETPWLETMSEDRKGTREWNIDINECLNDKDKHSCNYDPRFIVGKWGTGYKSTEGVLAVIPLTTVVRWRQLTQDKQAIADAHKEAERLKSEEAIKNRQILGEEFDKEIAELRKRVEELEANFRLLRLRQ